MTALPCRRVLMAILLSVSTLPAAAQDAPGLADSLPAPVLPPDASDDKTPAPTPPAIDPQLAEDVAKTAYLGGTGVVGPGALLGTIVQLVVAPALGAFASVVAQDGVEKKTSIARSTVAAYVRTLSYMGIFLSMWIPTIPMWFLGVVALPVAAASLVVWLGGLTPNGLQRGAGTAIALSGTALTALTLFIGVPWFVGRSSGILLGDFAWDRMRRKDSEAGADRSTRSELDKLMRKDLGGPLPSLRAGVLLAAVAGGVWERVLQFDGVPVAGPFITSVLAARMASVRLSQAREVAELGPLDESVHKQLLLVMLVRSTLLSMAQGGFISAAALLAAGGVGLAASSLIPGVGLPVGIAVLGGAVGLAALLAVASLVVGGAAFVSNAFVPWMLAFLASR